MDAIESKNLRIRPICIPEDYAHALEWYQDPEVMYFSVGLGVEPYDLDTVKSMYSYLKSIGEVYIIESLANDEWLPIGDVTLAKDTIPIVIGKKEYRSKGLGKQVIALLIERARQLGWQEINVKQIFDYNVRSHRMFTSLGFRCE